MISFYKMNKVKDGKELINVLNGWSTNKDQKLEKIDNIQWNLFFDFYRSLIVFLAKH